MVSGGKRTHILILGRGFAGLYAALELEKTPARDPDVEVTLVNQDNFFLFTPMLHEVAASDLDLTHIVNPVRKLLRRVRFFDGAVEAIDLEGRRVTVSHGAQHHHHEMAYDHLVLALGSITNFFHLPGLEERALTMKTLGDAIRLRNRLIEHLEEGDFECSVGSREDLLTFVVAGGGFAGVETVAAMNDFLREALGFYPHLDESLLRIVLVHPGEVILPELGESLGRYAQQKLAERKVEIHVKTRVTAFSERGVELTNGMTIPTKTLLWTAGTSPNPLLAKLPCGKDRGRVVTNEYLEVPAGRACGPWAIARSSPIRRPAAAMAAPASGR
jgi:NADH dehydrogenase